MVKLLQLNISLKESDPEIWRRFVINDSITFHELFYIIQDVMGWWEYEEEILYEFKVGDTYLRPLSAEDEEVLTEFAKIALEEFKEMEDFKEIFEEEGFSDEELEKELLLQKGLDSSQVLVSEFVKEEGQKFTYIYDFGTDWEHNLLVEKILPEDAYETVPICLDGANACPPDALDGIDEYKEYLKILKNKKNKRYEEVVEILGEDFDPKYFSVEEVNEFLEETVDVE